MVQHSSIGSRGSAVVLDQAGMKIHDRLDERWRIAPDNGDFKGKVLETSLRSMAKWKPVG